VDELSFSSPSLHLGGGQISWVCRCITGGYTLLPTCRSFSAAAIPLFFPFPCSVQCSPPAVTGGRSKMGHIRGDLAGLCVCSVSPGTRITWCHCAEPQHQKLGRGLEYRSPEDPKSFFPLQKSVTPLLLILLQPPHSSCYSPRILHWKALRCAVSFLLSIVGLSLGDSSTTHHLRLTDFAFSF
jgi:hypothetical protein